MSLRRRRAAIGGLLACPLLMLGADPVSAHPHAHEPEPDPVAETPTSAEPAGESSPATPSSSTPAPEATTPSSTEGPEVPAPSTPSAEGVAPSTAAPAWPQWPEGGQQPVVDWPRWPDGAPLPAFDLPGIGHIDLSGGSSPPGAHSGTADLEVEETAPGGTRAQDAATAPNSAGAGKPADGRAGAAASAQPGGPGGAPSVGSGIGSQRERAGKSQAGESGPDGHRSNGSREGTAAAAGVDDSSEAMTPVVWLLVGTATVAGLVFLLLGRRRRQFDPAAAGPGRSILEDDRTEVGDAAESVDAAR